MVAFSLHCTEVEIDTWGMGLILLKISLLYTRPMPAVIFSLHRTLSPNLFSPTYLCYHWKEFLSSSFTVFFSPRLWIPSFCTSLKLCSLFWIPTHFVLSSDSHIYKVSFLPIQKLTSPLKIGKLLDSASFMYLLFVLIPFSIKSYWDPIYIYSVTRLN